jgi:23S rRNA pseudouridine2605 synthase
MPQQRLQKLIAGAGIASRRKAEELITAGRVTVNGEVKNELGSKADSAIDDIRVDGKPLRAEEPVYVLLHKPKGYVTTVTDPENRPTVMDLVKAIPARVYPVGRLDYLSEGLLLLTNDGDIAAKLTHASTHVPKKYLVKVSGQPTEEQIQELRDGVQLPAEQGHIHAAPEEGGKFGGEKRRSTAVKTAPAKIELSREGDNPWYEVTLNEGRNRQIRRMFDFIGHHVEKIKRVEYGPLKLDVENGEFRMLNPAEIVRLKAASQGKHEAPRARDERPRTAKGGRGERPAFSRGRTGERAAFQKGSYKDRSEFESPREERTRTARFSADGTREVEAPREFRERPKFQKRDGERPVFRGRRDEGRSERPTFRGRSDGARGERPAFRGRPDDARGERPKFGKPPARRSSEGRPAPGGRFASAGSRGDRPFRGRPADGESRGKSFGRPPARTGSRPAFGDKPKFASSESRGERPFRGRPAAGGESRGKSFGRPPARSGSRPAFGGKPKFGARPDRGERGERPSGGPRRFDRGGPSREGTSERPPFRGKRDDRPSPRGPRREGGFSGGRSSGRPATGDRFGKKPGSFRKDSRPSFDRPVRKREDSRSQEFVDSTAKRFAGKLESGARGPRGPRKGPGGGAPKRPFRKPKDKR